MKQKIPPDFKDSPALKEPWSSSYVHASLMRTWELAGRPTEFGLSLMISARVPWHVFIGMDNGKYGSEGKTLAVLISQFSEYYAKVGDQ